MTSAQISERFRHFGEIEAKESSPLYSALALRVADDKEILEVVLAAPSNQPLSNLLFSAIQFMLAKEGRTIRSGDSPDLAYDLLRHTVLNRRLEVEHLLSTRLVQTNEVRRSIYLFSALAWICREFPDRPIALIEFGASAGLNLLFDKYEFRFGDSAPFGALGSQVSVRSELRRTPGRPGKAL